MRTIQLSSLLCLVAVGLAPARGLAQPAAPAEPADDTVSVVDDPAPAAPSAAPGCVPCRDHVAPASAPAAAPRPVFWRAALATSAVVVLSASAFGVYSQARMRSEADAIALAPSISWPPPSIGLSSSECGKSDAELAALGRFDRGHFDRACSWRDRSVIGFAAAGLGMVGAVVSLVMVVREGRESDAAVAQGRAPRRTLAIAPVVTPTGGGASLSVAW